MNSFPIPSYSSSLSSSSSASNRSFRPSVSGVLGVGGGGPFPASKRDIFSYRHEGSSSSFSSSPFSMFFPSSSGSGGGGESEEEMRGGGGEWNSSTYRMGMARSGATGGGATGKSSRSHSVRRGGEGFSGLTTSFHSSRQFVGGRGRGENRSGGGGSAEEEEEERGRGGMGMGTWGRKGGEDVAGSFFSRYGSRDGFRSLYSPSTATPDAVREKKMAALREEIQKLHDVLMRNSEEGKVSTSCRTSATTTRAVAAAGRISVALVGYGPFTTSSWKHLHEAGYRVEAVMFYVDEREYRKDVLASRTTTASSTSAVNNEHNTNRSSNPDSSSTASPFLSPSPPPSSSFSPFSNFSRRVGEDGASGGGGNLRTNWSEGRGRSGGGGGGYPREARAFGSGTRTDPRPLPPTSSSSSSLIHSYFQLVCPLTARWRQSSTTRRRAAEAAAFVEWCGEKYLPPSPSLSHLPTSTQGGGGVVGMGFSSGTPSAQPWSISSPMMTMMNPNGMNLLSPFSSSALPTPRQPSSPSPPSPPQVPPPSTQCGVHVLSTEDFFFNPLFTPLRDRVHVIFIESDPVLFSSLSIHHRSSSPPKPPSSSPSSLSTTTSIPSVVQRLVHYCYYFGKHMVFDPEVISYGFSPEELHLYIHTALLSYQEVLRSPGEDDNPNNVNEKDMSRRGVGDERKDEWGKGNRRGEEGKKRGISIRTANGSEGWWTSLQAKLEGESAQDEKKDRREELAAEGGVAKKRIPLPNSTASASSSSSPQQQQQQGHLLLLSPPAHPLPIRPALPLLFTTSTIGQWTRESMKYEWPDRIGAPFAPPPLPYSPSCSTGPSRSSLQPPPSSPELWSTMTSTPTTYPSSTVSAIGRLRRLQLILTVPSPPLRRLTEEKEVESDDDERRRRRGNRNENTMEGTCGTSTYSSALKIQPPLPSPLPRKNSSPSRSPLLMTGEDVLFGELQPPSPRTLALFAPPLIVDPSTSASTTSSSSPSSEKGGRVERIPQNLEDLVVKVIRGGGGETSDAITEEKSCHHHHYRSNSKNKEKGEEEGRGREEEEEVEVEEVFGGKPARRRRGKQDHNRNISQEEQNDEYDYDRAEEEEEEDAELLQDALREQQDEKCTKEEKERLSLRSSERMGESKRREMRRQPQKKQGPRQESAPSPFTSSQPPSPSSSNEKENNNQNKNNATGPLGRNHDYNHLSSSASLSVHFPFIHQKDGMNAEGGEKKEEKLTVLQKTRKEEEKERGRGGRRSGGKKKENDSQEGVEGGEARRWKEAFKRRAVQPSTYPRFRLLITPSWWRNSSSPSSTGGDAGSPHHFHLRPHPQQQQVVVAGDIFRVLVRPAVELLLSSMRWVMPYGVLASIRELDPLTGTALTISGELFFATSFPAGEGERKEFLLAQHREEACPASPPPVATRGEGGGEGCTTTSITSSSSSSSSTPITTQNSHCNGVGCIPQVLPAHFFLSCAPGTPLFQCLTAHGTTGVMDMPAPWLPCALFHPEEEEAAEKNSSSGMDGNDADDGTSTTGTSRSTSSCSHSTTEEEEEVERLIKKLKEKEAKIRRKEEGREGRAGKSTTTSSNRAPPHQGKKSREHYFFPRWTFCYWERRRKGRTIFTSRRTLPSPILLSSPPHPHPHRHNHDLYGAGGDGEGGGGGGAGRHEQPQYFSFSTRQVEASRRGKNAPPISPRDLSTSPILPPEWEQKEVERDDKGGRCAGNGNGGKGRRRPTPPPDRVVAGKRGDPGTSFTSWRLPKVYVSSKKGSKQKKQENEEEEDWGWHRRYEQNINHKIEENVDQKGEEEEVLEVVDEQQELEGEDIAHLVSVKKVLALPPEIHARGQTLSCIRSILETKEEAKIQSRLVVLEKQLHDLEKQGRDGGSGGEYGNKNNDPHNTSIDRHHNSNHKDENLVSNFSNFSHRRAAVHTGPRRDEGKGLELSFPHPHFSSPLSPSSSFTSTTSHHHHSLSSPATDTDCGISFSQQLVIRDTHEAKTWCERVWMVEQVVQAIWESSVTAATSGTSTPSIAGIVQKKERKKKEKKRKKSMMGI